MKQQLRVQVVGEVTEQIINDYLAVAIRIWQRVAREEQEKATKPPNDAA